jgi:hypothetical protein
MPFADTFPTALGAAATMTTVVLVAISSRLARISTRGIQMEFKSAEADVLRSVEERVKQASDEEPLTWADLEGGKLRDTELRQVVDTMSRRLSRVEAVSERIEVRRQALLETYHSQGLSQSRISFWFSLLLGVLGFSVIVYGILTENRETSTYISGAVTEAVAALFFTQSNQARKLMAEFFDKLRDDRRLEDALKLTDNIDEPRLKSSLQALLAMELVSSATSPSVLPGFYPDRDDKRTALTAPATPDPE